jgi:hypothetical protein
MMMPLAGDSGQHPFPRTLIPWLSTLSGMARSTSAIGYFEKSRCQKRGPNTATFIGPDDELHCPLRTTQPVKSTTGFALPATASRAATFVGFRLMTVTVPP